MKRYCKVCKTIYDNETICANDKNTLTDIPKNVKDYCILCHSEDVTYHVEEHEVNGWTGIYKIDGTSYCKKCKDKMELEIFEQSNIIYMVLQELDEDGSIFDNHFDMSEYVEKIIDDNCDYVEGEVDDIIILELYEIKDTYKMTCESFTNGNTNMMFYDSKWYKVKKAYNPSIECDRSINI